MGLMYMATERFGTWVECPRINMQAGKVGWETVSKFLNGGNYIRRSTTSAKEYDMEWGLRSRDQLRPVLDFADYIYGEGDIYFCDPFAMDKNVLPAYWASPFMNGIDGPLTGTTLGGYTPSVSGDWSGVLRPAIVDLGQSVNGYPTRAGGILGQHSLFIPVPPGYRLDWGYHSDAGSHAMFTLQMFQNGVASGSEWTPVNLPVAGSTRFNLGLGAGMSTGMGVRITHDESMSDMSYAGMIAQIVPDTVAPSTGGFISGQGHSGLQFAAQPTYYEYSAALDKVQASARLVEVGAWRSI